MPYYFECQSCQKMEEISPYGIPDYLNHPECESCCGQVCDKCMSDIGICSRCLMEEAEDAEREAKGI